MAKRIFIGYATWAGATREVAEYIAKILSEQNYEVDVKNIKGVKDAEEYDAYILGTSIHAGKISAAFSRYIRRNQKKLASRPNALFTVCANLFEDTKENREETLSWLNKGLDDLAEINPIDIGLFAGAVVTAGEDFKNLNFVIRWIIKSMEKTIIEKYDKSDFRDWKTIEKWAKDIGKRL